MIYCARDLLFLHFLVVQNTANERLLRIGLFNLPKDFYKEFKA